MDKPSVVVRHSNGGQPADDLVVGLEEIAAAVTGNANAETTMAGAADATSANRQTATSTQIADKTHAVNTTGKFKGRLVYNTTTDMMWFALGSVNTSKWRPSYASDNSADVTPA
jgi:N-acetylglutamate synthase/N-acetylornithine aminotransferase